MIVGIGPGAPVEAIGRAPAAIRDVGGTVIMSREA
jgi:hypothetical protein